MFSCNFRQYSVNIITLQQIMSSMSASQYNNTLRKHVILQIRPWKLTEALQLQNELPSATTCELSPNLAATSCLVEVVPSHSLSRYSASSFFLDDVIEYKVSSHLTVIHSFVSLSRLFNVKSRFRCRLTVIRSCLAVRPLRFYSMSIK
jgi:hypothetical protein